MPLKHWHGYTPSWSFFPLVDKGTGGQGICKAKGEAIGPAATGQLQVQLQDRGCGRTIHCHTAARGGVTSIPAECQDDGAKINWWHEIETEGYVTFINYIIARLVNHIHTGLAVNLCPCAGCVESAILGGCPCDAQPCPGLGRTQIDSVCDPIPGFTAITHKDTSRMSLINILNVQVLDNPSPFTNPFQFEITFECVSQLKEGLQHAHIIFRS